MKKKNILATIITILSLLFLIQCTGNDVLERNYPTIETLQVTSVSENGVQFNATISNVNQYDIIEYGFVWSTSSFPDVNISDKKIISSNMSSGDFSANITTTLVNGRKYYVRSFVKTNSYLVYGNQKEFQSFGSGSALILSVEPNTGVWGDTIQIKGKNFSFVAANNKVTFKDKIASVIKSSDSIIKAVVPEGVNSKEVTVGLEIANRETYAATKFVIKSPTITSITPLTATFGDEITITGDNFGIKPEYNKVYFGNILTTIISSDKNTIKVTVPNDLELSTTPIKVQTHAIDVTHSTSFKLKSPILSFINLGVRTDSITIIKGKYFHPIKEKNIITFEGNQAEVVEVFKDSVKIKIPIGPFPRRKAKVKIQLLDDIVEYSNDINILNKWVQISNSLPFRFSYTYSSNSVTANNKAYIISPVKEYDYSQSYQELFLWEFDDTTLTWSKNILPFSTDSFHYYDYALSSNGQNLYLYIPNSNNNFWEYNTTSKNWSKKENFIGVKRNRVTTFSVNNEIYIGLGYDKVNYVETYYKDLYKYNPVNNTWTKLNDLNIDYSSFISNIRVNDKVYFVGGNNMYGHYVRDCFYYDYKTDSWTQIATLYTRNIFTGFALNDYIYIPVNSAYYKYDTKINTWELHEKIEKYGRSGQFSFELNGKGYFGSGRSNYHRSDIFDMYQFID